MKKHEKTPILTGALVARQTRETQKKTLTRKTLTRKILTRKTQTRQTLGIPVHSLNYQKRCTKNTVQRASSYAMKRRIKYGERGQLCNRGGARARGHVCTIR